MFSILHRGGGHSQEGVMFSKLCSPNQVIEVRRPPSVSALLLAFQVSMRDWRMTFLPAFKMCVEEGAHNLVCSYNRFVKSRFQAARLKAEWPLRVTFAVIVDAETPLSASWHRSDGNTALTLTSAPVAVSMLPPQTKTSCFHQPFHRATPQSLLVFS